jgi:hypothetical protein
MMINSETQSLTQTGTVEVSGWDENEVFFVERSELGWDEYAGKHVTLSRLHPICAAGLSMHGDSLTTVLPGSALDTLWALRRAGLPCAVIFAVPRSALFGRFRYSSDA